MFEKPFFVVGVERSGTTMLRLMLNMHPHLHIPRETKFWSRVLDEIPSEIRLNEQQVNRVWEIITSQPRWLDQEISGSELRRILQSESSQDLAALMGAVYQFIIDRDTRGKPRWGDKTPSYVREISRLNKVFPKAKFIHIIRDGRDTCMSLAKTGWYGDTIWAIARNWSKTIELGRRQGAELPEDQYLEVNYEQLVLNSEFVLRNVCKFLEEQYDPRMLKFYEQSSDSVAQREEYLHTKIGRAPEPSDINRWCQEMPILQIAAFEAFAGSAMDEVGQRRKFRGAASIIPLVIKNLIIIVESTLPLRQHFGLHFPTLRKRL